jgi:ABC-type transport system involved in cytochrome c biogenesis permease subunit
MSSQATLPAKPTPLLTRQRALGAVVVLLAVLALLLVLSPPERQLGNLVKVIYFHGALARSGMLALMAAGVLGLAYLLRPLPALVRWSNAVQVAGMAVFIAHFLLSVIPTHETWGVWIAFDEPRTVMSLQVIGAGLVVMVVRYLVDDDRLSALANLLLGVAVFLLSSRTGVLRHPLNPIGDSTSNTIQLFYGGILITCLALTALAAWLLADRAGTTTQPEGELPARPPA